MLTRLVIISNYHYNDLINKLQQNPKYTVPQNELGVIYSPNNLDVLKKIIHASLVSNVQTYYNTVQSKGQLIHNKSFTSNKYKDIINRICEYLQLHCYDIAISALKLLSEIVTVPIEKIKVKEYLAIAYFLHSSFVSKDNKLEFNKEIESLFTSAISSYKKMNEELLHCECLLRLATYFANFPSMNDKFKIYVMKTFAHCQNLNPEKQLEINMKIGWIYHERKMLRKEKLNIFTCFSICFDHYDNLKHMMPVMLEKLKNSFQIYDIEKNKITSLELFNQVHAKYIKHEWKKIEINLCKKNKENGKNEIQEYTRKKIEKGSKIVVRRQMDKIKNYIIEPYWFRVQQSVYLGIINFFKQNKEYAKTISFALSYLQTLFDYLPKNEQKNIINSYISESLMMQTKLNLSLLNVPILVRVLPISSPIKFDIIKNPKVQGQQEQLFLYNPWEKNASINYYWTQNSYQNISVEFHNNFKTKITVSKISIIFSSSKDKTKSSNNIIISYPSTITISPESKVDIIVKNHPISQGQVDIIGVSYEIMNSISKQYVDSNGNGLYYSQENLFVDSTTKKIGPGSKKKKLINLKNIQIYPEIPVLDIKILDNSINSIDDSIELYEHQEYTFSFLIENTGKYSIDEIKCNVYAYKKEDYKISLKEINIKTGSDGKTIIPPGGNYKIDYVYLHKSSHLKIEFRVYYISHQRNKETEGDEILLKPFLLYAKTIHTEKLLDIKDIKLLPKIDGCSIGEIVKSDSRLHKRYNYTYCASLNIFSFTISNWNQNKMFIKLFDKESKLLKEELIKHNFSKEISFECPLDMDFMSMVLKWDFITTENVKGVINLKDIFNDYTHIFKKRKCEILFEINVKQSKEDTTGLDYSLIRYKIVNKSGRILNKTKILIYFFQFYDGNYIYNDYLPDEILFYEGSLVQLPKSPIEDNGSFENEIKLYKSDTLTMIKTSMVMLDKESETVYLCPFDKEC